MELSSGRSLLNLIAFAVLMASISAPAAAQRGIDLLDPEQLLPTGANRLEPSETTTTVRVRLADVQEATVQASHGTTTYKYDDGEFESFRPGVSRPYETEYAQLFDLKSAGELATLQVCFQRPLDDVTRNVVFQLFFYDDNEGSPGRAGALSYLVEGNIRSAGTTSCLRFAGALGGKSLSRGDQWVGVRWRSSTNKRLGVDEYTATDPMPRDSRGRLKRETEVFRRSTSDGVYWQNWQPETGDHRTMKAVGIRLVVDHSPDHTPDPDPDPDPPDPTPSPTSMCSAGTCVLQDGRFRVRTRYAMTGMRSQTAGTIEAELGQSAALFTFGSDDPALLVRIVNDCTANGQWLLYAGAATEATYSIAVRDTMTNALKWFRASGGESIRDHRAFACSGN